MTAQFAELFEQFKAEARANLDQARADADAAGPGRRMMRVDLLSLHQALADPVLRESMVKALFAARSTAQGLTGGPACECLCCGSRWTDDRRPGGVAMIRMIKPEQASIALICWQCLAQPRGRLRKAIVAVMKQHFGADEEVLPTPVGGRA